MKVRPNKKSDLTDYRRAKRVQDYLNWAMKPNAEGVSNWFASTFNAACGRKILPVDEPE